MKNKIKTLFLLITLLFFSANASAWNCDVVLNGPGVIKEGQTITLTAEGAPEGGSYSWSTTKNLETHGSFALLTVNEEPEFSEYIGVRVTYTSPKGKKCSDKKYIWFCRCYTKISSPDKYKIGDPPIQLTASQDPSGGTFEWTPTIGLTVLGEALAEFESDIQGKTTIEVSYTPPGETEPCYDTHNIEVVKKCEVSISGDPLVRQGESIPLMAMGEPEGGTYQWPEIPGLISEGGNTAEFTGQTPGDVEIDVLYTPPEETEACPVTHEVKVLGPCTITIDGPDIVDISETITLTAEGSPSSGTFYWPSMSELVNKGQTATFTGLSPGEFAFEVTYLPDDGGVPCTSETFTILVVPKCDVTITGPTDIFIGDTITLEAFSQSGNSARESVGTYKWIQTSGLVADGNMAKFTGQYAGQIVIGVEYTPPGESEPCPVVEHLVRVKEKCSVIINGPSEIYRGKEIKLTAFGSHGEGTYTWGEMPGLETIGNTAYFSSPIPGEYNIIVFYETGDEGAAAFRTGENSAGEGEESGVYVSCFGSLNITVKDFEITSFSGPSCVYSGTTLIKSDFQIETNPSGFEDQVIVSPLTFSNVLFQTKNAIVTASKSGEEPSNPPSTNITVVNSSNKTTHGMSFEIPNYIKKPLETIGIAEKVELSFGYDFKSFYECCGVGSGKSTSGTYNVALNISSEPFTIIGIPVPPKYKKYLSIDAVAIKLNGKSDLTLNGSYKICNTKTKWNGGGSLTLGLTLNGGIKVKSGSAIDLKGEVSAGTIITEALAKKNSESSEFELTTNWGGLILTGNIKFVILDDFELISYNPSKTFFEKGGLAPLSIQMPGLE